MTLASILTIGNELLSGFTVDTNSAWIAQQLNGIGMTVRRRIALPDVAEDITQTLQSELEQVQVVIITGGLGPTNDDITKKVLCEFFGGKLVENETVLAQVSEMFSRRGKPLLDINRLQAAVPDVCTVLFNKMGTAPGMWFEQDGKVVISLPGVPYEMIHIMEAEALPRLRQYFHDTVVVHRSILTAGEGESFVAKAIEDLEAALPEHIRLAYLPSPGMVRLRLTGRGTDEQSLIKEMEMRRDEIANRLEHLVVTLDDLPLEHIIGKMLTAREETLGLAESCTGGYVAHYLTQIMGSASYFQGSVVCYQESVKEELLGVKEKTIEKYCVVSEEVAREMAHGARKALKADYGFGVTGLLSGGGTDRVPVGTVCMAMENAARSYSKTFHFHLDRLRNKELATQHALLLIWRFINGKI